MVAQPSPEQALRYSPPSRDQRTSRPEDLPRPRRRSTEVTHNNALQRARLTTAGFSGTCARAVERER